MHEQKITFEDALAALQIVQYDYVDGKGDYGPVIMEFTEILNRYQKNFYNWQPYKDVYAEEKRELGTTFAPMLKTAAILAVIFFFYGMLFHSGFALAVFYIAAGIVMGSTAKNPAWSVGVIGCTLAMLFVSSMENMVGFHKYIFWIFLAFYVVSALKNRVEDQKKGWVIDKDLKKRSNEVKRIENALESDQRKLKQLMPALREEYAEIRAKIINECAEVLNDEQKETLCKELPLVFWWEISLEELQEIDSKLEYIQTGDVVWETRWVNRTVGSEFKNAGEEFSPLVPIYENEAFSKQLYETRKAELYNGQVIGGVFDFISKGTSSVMESETIYYQDYKYSDFNRFAKEMTWMGLGNSIDRSYQTGEISESDYKELRNEYFWGSVLVNDAVNQKIEKTATEYRQIKSSTNIWTGQMLLMNDEDLGGVAIIDYRCQIPHLFRNLDTLRDVKITRVLGDPVHRNPVVMAKIHRVCRDCR